MFFFKEKDIAKLRQEMLDIKAGINLETDNPRLANLMTQNSKLKHRLAILNRVNTESEYSCWTD